jgi:PleD family two-component response regulator
VEQEINSNQRFMKKHVLIIDDDKDEMKSFYAALNNVPGSFKCTYASSGRQALDMLNYIRPDFIFVDLYLSGMDGIELLELIREDRRFHETKIFLYAPYVTEGIRDIVMESGANGCIAKSPDHELTGEELETLIGGIVRPSLSLSE